jgi:hypothetical protein
MRHERGGFGPHLVHTQSEPEQCAAVSSGASFAQVAGVILQKQARVENPDKDEVPNSRASLRYPVSGAGTGASCFLDFRHRIC